MSSLGGYEGPERRGHKRRAADTQIGLTGMVDALDEHVVTMTAEVAMLRHDVVEERQERRAKQRWLMTAIAVLVISLVGLVYVVSSNRALVREQQRQDQRFVECTTPGNPASANPDDRVHECYDQGQQRQADAIRQIIEGVRAKP